VPHRCIDGGAGVDGCPVREFFEVLGRDPTWRQAVQADVGGTFGLRDAIARDALGRQSVGDRPRAPLALPAPPPFEIPDLMKVRSHEHDA
jgi:hypothetical protein